VDDNAPVPRRRLGVALLVPEPARQEIDGIRRAVGDPAMDRIPPHLTLVPPVNVREDDMGDALDVLRHAAARLRPLTLTLGPPQTFLPVNPVLYLAIHGPELPQLYRLRNDVFRPPLERKLTWPFVPHVTLADGVEPVRIAHAHQALDRYERTVTFESVHVLEEREHHTWVPIAEVRFEPPSVVGRGAPGLELELRVTDALDDRTRRWVDERWPSPRRGLTVTGRREGATVGVAVGWTDGDQRFANITELFVDPSVRRQGVGTHLLAAFLSAAAERGATYARLRADLDSDAERFYAGRGWRREATYDRIAQLVKDL
jgi:2'-5' RNA ligase/predicted GNAT family acetyltransferase